MNRIGYTLFGWFRRKAVKPTVHIVVSLNHGTAPTVKFDTSRVTDAVKAEIKRCVGEIEGPTTSQRASIYDAALRSVMAGRDLHTLCVALMDFGIEGMTKRKTTEAPPRVGGGRNFGRNVSCVDTG